MPSNLHVVPKVYLPLPGEVIRTTTKAILVAREGVFGHNKEVWIPRSQVKNGDFVKVGDGVVQISQWFAEKEGIVKKESKYGGR